MHLRFRRRQSERVGETDPMLPRRKRRGLGVVPTFFTLGNCLCGFTAICFAARGNDRVFPDIDFTYYSLAGYLIFVAMLFDMLDGFMARLTHSSSDFGAELDSMADMVSFGIAPAFLALRVIGDFMAPLAIDPVSGPVTRPHVAWPGPLSSDAWMRLFWFIGAIYVCCTALRLARFNVMNKHEVESHMNFRGLPSPGAAAVVAATIVFFKSLFGETRFIWFNVPPRVVEIMREVFPYFIPFILLVAALLMVSRFAYAHLVNRFLRGRRRFSYVARLVIVILLLAWQPQLTVLTAIYLYAMSAPTLWLWRLLIGKRAVPSLIEPPQPAQ